MHNIHFWSICTLRNTLLLWLCICLQLLAGERTFTAMSKTKEWNGNWRISISYVSIGWRNDRIVFICALQQSALEQCDFHTNFFSDDFIYRLHKISTCNAQRNCFRRNDMSVVGTTPQCCTQSYFVAIVVVLSKWLRSVSLLFYFVKHDWRSVKFHCNFSRSSRTTTQRSAMVSERCFVVQMKNEKRKYGIREIWYDSHLHCMCSWYDSKINGIGECPQSDSNELSLCATFYLSGACLTDSIQLKRWTLAEWPRVFQIGGGNR